MGLIQRVEFENGLIAENCYHKVGSVSHGDNTGLIELLLYKDQPAKNDGKPVIDKKYYVFIPSVEDNAPNAKKQAYLYLKSLPEFTNVIDA